MDGPDPKRLAELKAIDPKYADALMAEFQEQVSHNRGMEKQRLDNEFAIKKRGQLFGLLVGLGGLVAAVFLGYSGNEVAAGFVGSLNLAGMVSVFVLGKKASPPRAGNPLKKSSPDAFSTT